MKKPIINPGIIKRLKSIFAIVQDGDVATRNIASGKYVLWKNVPCHASSAITTGDTLAIGTNLTADNDGFINALHDGLSAFSGKAIANNLTTETAGYVLDARQGKALNDSIAHFGSELKVLRFTGTTDSNGNVYYSSVTPASHVILGATADGDKACTVFLNGDSTGYNYHISSYANWSIGNGISVAVTVYYVDK